MLLASKLGLVSIRCPNGFNVTCFQNRGDQGVEPIWVFSEYIFISLVIKRRQKWIYSQNSTAHLKNILSMVPFYLHLST